MRRFVFALTLCVTVGATMFSTLLPSKGWAQAIDLNPVVTPADPAKLHPVERVPRQKFGLVGSFPLGENDLKSLVYPSATKDEIAAALEGLSFFTTPHVASEGLGPFANQRFCQGCHLNSDFVIRNDQTSRSLVTTSSMVSRASRSSTTNFFFTSFNPITGGGRAPDNVDALDSTGKTAAFTLFGDFNPTTNAFNGLGTFSTGSVQRVRPALSACVPDRIPLLAEDPVLGGFVDPITFLSASGFRRTTGERAAPPYIGRGLIEAVFDGDILANEATEHLSINSSLDQPGDFPECGNTDCLNGRHNQNTSNQAFIGGHTDPRVGRLGLRAAGPTLLQFMIGGSQGELGITSPFRPEEPISIANVGRAGCVNTASEPNIPASTPLSLRTLIRLVAPPEFGQTLLHVLNRDNPDAPWPAGSPEEKVQRGARLFGIDLTAFADRTLPGRMPAGGDGRDQHAINQADRKLNCAGCHLPVVATGQLPAEVGAEHLSNVWVPLFTDLLIHPGPDINAERIAPTSRLPLPIMRESESGQVLTTLDLARNMTDDTLPNQGVATGREWRTPPLMGLGKIGPPFFHDARIFLSDESVSTTPAGTVYSAATTTNSPLVVQSLDEAIRAAIELHDLPAPFNAPNQSAETGGGCPVPPGNRIGDVIYQNGAADICPPYESTASQQNRGDARKVVRRWHRLTEEDQAAVVQFLKEL